MELILFYKYFIIFLLLINEIIFIISYSFSFIISFNLIKNKFYMEFSKPKSKLQSSYSIKTQCKSKLTSLFYSLRSQSSCFLLITDEKCLKIISSCLKMVELMETGVTAVEKLELKRKPFPGMHAIYFISPELKSLDLLLSDFSNNEKPQYGSVHLFSIRRISQQFMSSISSNKSLLNRIKTFKEVYMDFLSLEDCLFHMDVPEALPNIFSKIDVSNSMIEEISTRLGHVACNFEKIYEFEIVYFERDNRIGEKFCSKLTSTLNFQLQQLEKYNPEILDPKAGKVYIIILDRAFDGITPLMHDFFYQPMVYDLLEIKNNYYEYKDEKDGKEIIRKAYLNDGDDLFNRYKYKHIAEVLDGIPGEFQNFISQNTTAKLQQGIISNLDLQKMSDIIKTMPQYNELLSKYTLHMKLIENAWHV